MVELADLVDTPLERWEKYTEVNHTPKTGKLYRRALHEFCNSIDVTPDELYDLHFKASKSEDPRMRGALPLKLSEFMRDLVKKGRAEGTARTYAKAVRSFFKVNRLEFELLPGEIPKAEHQGQRYIGADEIKMLLERVSAEFWERNRALIMVLKDTGLRVSDVAGFDVEHFETADKILDDQGEFRVFNELYRIKKTRSWAYVHMGPEAVDKVKEYIALDRRSSGPMFLDRDGKRIRALNITTILRRLCRKLNKGGKVSAHSLRKFHETQLETAKMSDNWISKLQGRLIRKSTGPYSKPEEARAESRPEDTSVLTEAYIKAYPKLSVLSGPEVSREEVEDQKTRIKDLEAQLEEERKLREEFQAGILEQQDYILKLQRYEEGYLALEGQLEEERSKREMYEKTLELIEDRLRRLEKELTES